VLALTRGKRVVMAGGQGAREFHRQALQRALQMDQLEWVTSERGRQSGAFHRLEERISAHQYDLVLYLAAFVSHQGGGVVAACKRGGTPLVYLARGYSLAAVVQAVSDQLARSRDEHDLRRTITRS
jgi:hypothetical protein